MHAVLQYLLFSFFGDESTIELQRDTIALSVMCEAVVVAAVLVDTRRVEEKQVLSAPLLLEVACTYRARLSIGSVILVIVDFLQHKKLSTSMYISSEAFNRQ